MQRLLCLILVCTPLAAWAQAAPPPASEAPENLQPPPPPPVPPPPPLVGVQRQSDFMDTRLNFTCADEDMLRDPQVLPTAPGFHCGRPNPLGILFFDNYDTRFSGFETLTNLSLYKRWSDRHWDFEGGVVIRVNEFSETAIGLADGGSYIRAAYWFDPERRDPKQLTLIAFPVSSDRMRLGFSYRISWGGSPEFFTANPDIPGSTGPNSNSVPGAKLQFDTGTAYAYVGIKSSLLLNPVTNEQEGVLAFLAGAGVDVTDWLKVEANGGVFDRGKNPTPDVLGKQVMLYGASAQVVAHRGMPVGTSIDYALYRNEPLSIARLFAKESYPGGLSWSIGPELTVIAQTLKDPNSAGSTRTQVGHAADLNLRVKYNYTRLHLDLMTRDLAFILHSIPSLPTYWDFPDTYQTSDEYFAAVGADQFLPAYATTAGLTVGVDKPATLTSPTAIQGELTDPTMSTTLVIPDQNTRTVLPQGKDAALKLAVKGSLRKDFGDAFAAIVDVYYQYDPNTVRYDRGSSDSSFIVAKFASFDQLGFDLTLQARF